MKKRVVIIGAGIAGLTVATLLHEKNFEVELLESEEAIGGLAKSKRSAAGFPIEHSLRIYHKVYDCLFSILKKIPYDKTSSVFDQLTPVSPGLVYENEILFYPASKNHTIIKSIKDRLKLTRFLYRHGFTFRDFFTLFKEELLIRSSWERLMAKTSHVSMGEYFTKNKVSKSYLGVIYANYIVAFAATHKTLSALGVQMDTEVNPFSFFCMMNGPTSERMFVPWEKYLTEKEVVIKKQARVSSLKIEDKKIKAAVLSSGEEIQGDIFVSAVSNLEFLKLIPTINELKEVPSLKNFQPQIEWCNGVQFFLSDLPKVQGKPIENFQPGNVIVHLDSSWKLVSIVQGDCFWKNVSLPKECRYVLSVTFSAVSVKGTLYNKALLECSLEEIYSEILRQCNFEQTNLVLGWNFSESIVIMNDQEYSDNKLQLRPHIAHKRLDGNWMLNFSPLTVETPESFKLAPKPKTPIENFYLSGHYCNTSMLISTMEKASESGFRTAQQIVKDWCPDQEIRLPFKSYNTKNYPVCRTIDAFLFKLGDNIKRIFKR